MSANKIASTAVSLLFIMLLAAAIPSSAIADGGPIVPHDLWGDLEEGHQIGVVTILNENTATIDLFISILDSTNESHEITFFVPIGKNPASFAAMEEDLFTFDKANTERLDKIIRDGATRKQRAVQALFAGALLTNGAVLVPAWAPVLLTGCGATAQQPEAVLTTESSEISIYGIDDNTDIDALIDTTGLPSSVADTLASLKGQRVAIVKLQTSTGNVEVAGENANPWNPQYAEPGLHLSWSTEIVPTETGRTVVYPLGTGAAWSKPIELTRVYIDARKGMDFNVQYPELGEEHSGFDLIEGSKILDYTDVPAYAIDEARGDFGRVWRATYTQSNPTADVIITVKPESGMSRFLAGFENGALGFSILFAIFIGITIWVLAWHFLMPVFLGKRPNAAGLDWFEALIYPGINLVFMIIPGSILYLVFLIGAAGPALGIQFLFGAGISIGTFMLIHSKRLGVSRGKAFGAFILTSLCSSAAYLLLAVGFAFLVNAM